MVYRSRAAIEAQDDTAPLLPLSKDGRGVISGLRSWWPGPRAEAVRAAAASTEAALVDAVFEMFLEGDKREIAAAALWQSIPRPFEYSRAGKERRALAVDAARRRGPRIVPRLLERVEAVDHGVCYVALFAIEALAPPEVLERLLDATRAVVARDPFASIRSPALFRALAVHRDARALPLLEAALAIKDYDEYVIDAISVQGTIEAAEVLIHLFDDNRMQVSARQALGGMLDNPAVLERLMTSRDSSSRRQVVGYLRDGESADGTERLLGLVLDEDPFVRADAATALARRKDPRAVALIARAIVTPTHAWEIAPLADALADLGDSSALPALREALSQRRPRNTDRPDSPPAGLPDALKNEWDNFKRYGGELEAEGAARVRAAITRPSSTPRTCSVRAPSARRSTARSLAIHRKRSNHSARIRRPKLRAR